MKKMICSAMWVLLTGLVLQAQTVYINPEFDSLAMGHKELAILPFKVTIKLKPRKMKKLEIEDLIKLEKAEGEEVQTALFDYFLKEKGKDSSKVSFQDISKTNALLAEMGWTNDSYRPKNLEQVC